MDFIAALQQLMPPGIALNPQSTEVADLLQKTADEFDAYSLLEAALFAEVDPRVAVLLLLEYETSLGLPDRCSTGVQSISERQMAVYNKMLDTGGARRTRYLAMLARLGQEDAAIERFGLYTCESTCETPVFSDTEWLFTWAVTLKDNVVVTAATCQSHCEEPLNIWGNTMIECVLDREKPAYSILIFRYLSE